eukprot:CAMPEP_0172305488 /NCGR_PEP_ID=MMETSP1058-20130122/6762_1 /TAXON_ID=83371 /ORGANISM="Detonula confervacea, Strain CCMP 353" /LENGTH=101 /DNA_ID=CAMNT_0013017097 /DNA_START=892 /DNA_END=1195 /DNA_ORIENTATION=-
MVLTPRMNVLARRPLSGPLTLSTAPTRLQAMIVEMGEFSPSLALLVNFSTSSSSNPLNPAQICLSAMGVAATSAVGGDQWEKTTISLPMAFIIVPDSGAFD